MKTTVSRGVFAPIVRSGDNIVDIVVSSVLRASKEDGFAIEDADVVCVTESVVARADGNYATIEQIAADLREKFPSGTIGVVFPILSRNRFAVLLRAIARAAKRVVVQLQYPCDEVGNQLVDADALDESGLNPYTDVLDVPTFRKLFGRPLHPFTGMDYVDYYQSIIRQEGAEAELIFSNRPETILAYTDCVLCADIHTRSRTARKLQTAGAHTVYTLCDILSAPRDGSGYHPTYGLLGSNRADDDTVKLFPKNAQTVVEAISEELFLRTGKHVEAMVYGDGAFRDPVGGIWELADPVVAPAFTKGLTGQPNEVKLKYLADNALKDLSGDALEDAMRDAIRKKSQQLGMTAMGTTPRRITDLLGSLCDLTSGSGDKGTPIVLVQGYFQNYADA